MTREEMLEVLHGVKFALIWPPSSWEDVGFTEREIWVNNEGYGYIMCDEPTARGSVQGIEREKWISIRKKLQSHNLAFEDVEGTSLVELLEIVSFGEFYEEDNPCDYLEGLLDLPDDQLDCIYFLQTFDGWEFFDSEEARDNMLERDWCDYEWKELSDEMLAVWIARLIDEGLLHGDHSL